MFMFILNALGKKSSTVIPPLQLRWVFLFWEATIFFKMNGQQQLSDMFVKIET